MFPNPRQSRKGALLMLGLGLGVFVGACLWTHFYDRFVFIHQGKYTFFASIVFVALWLPAAVLLRRNGFTQETPQIPTRWVRRLVMFPLSVLLVCGAVVVAPLGWFAAGVWMFGTKRLDMPARVLYVEEYQDKVRSSHCSQNVEIQLVGVETKVCLTKVYKGRDLQAGETVGLRGKELASGFYIELIEELKRPGSN